MNQGISKTHDELEAKQKRVTGLVLKHTSI